MKWQNYHHFDCFSRKR